MKFTCIIYFIVRIGGKKIEIMSSATSNSTNPANWIWEKSGSYFFLIAYPNGGGNDNPLQSSCLEYPMDRRAWRGTVLGATKPRRSE